MIIDNTEIKETGRLVSFKMPDYPEVPMIRPRVPGEPRTFKRHDILFGWAVALADDTYTLETLEQAVLRNKRAWLYLWGAVEDTDTVASDAWREARIAAYDRPSGDVLERIEEDVRESAANHWRTGPLTYDARGRYTTIGGNIMYTAIAVTYDTVNVYDRNRDHVATINDVEWQLVSATPYVRIDAVDLFSGAGGLTHGLTKAGINVRVGVDVDPACEYPYTENNKAKFILKSVGDIELASYYPSGSVRLLAGCAPCQTFSSCNRKDSTDDDRWWLLRYFSQLVGGLHPELVAMENVPGLLDHAVFDEFVASLEARGYEVSKQIVNCQDYGVPQHQNRLILLASRLGPISLLTPAQFNAKPMSVREAIGNGVIPPLAAGSTDAVPVPIGELIGRSLKAHVEAHRDDALRLIAEHTKGD